MRKRHTPKTNDTKTNDRWNIVGGTDGLEFDRPAILHFGHGTNKSMTFSVMVDVGPSRPTVEVENVLPLEQNARIPTRRLDAYKSGELVPKTTRFTPEDPRPYLKIALEAIDNRPKNMGMDGVTTKKIRQAIVGELAQIGTKPMPDKIPATQPKAPPQQGDTAIGLKPAPSPALQEEGFQKPPHTNTRGFGF